MPTAMSESTHSVTLRPATADDETFLLQLYASTRDDLRSLDWDEQQKQALIKMQYDARRFQYDECYPQAEASMILNARLPVGRLLVHESDREITLVDIALMPEHRNLGIGAGLIQQLLNRAVAAKKPVRLHVLKSNPALNLYERLGFLRTGDQSMYFEMTFNA
jgi:ribosomal protein S18 acetylase RimI-like enzyme